MKPSAPQIGDLLALKRHERPPEGYMDDFLREFHMRRREEAVEKRGARAWWSRVTEWVSDAGSAKWAYGAGLAYATIAAVFLLAERPVESSPSLEPVRYQVVPAQPTGSLQQLDELDLRPSSQGTTGDQEF